jgi:hypothetical protein
MQQLAPASSSRELASSDLWGAPIQGVIDFPMQRVVYDAHHMHDISMTHAGSTLALTSSDYARTCTNKTCLMDKASLENNLMH